ADIAAVMVVRTATASVATATHADPPRTVNKIQARRETVDRTHKGNRDRTAVDIVLAARNPAVTTMAARWDFSSEDGAAADRCTLLPSLERGRAASAAYLGGA